MLVRAPSDPSRFSGRVFLEPFNTSGTADADIVWSMIGPILEEQGDAWIGVTARSSSVAPLQQFDPVRYAGLTIATNDLEWDILRHIGGLLKENGAQSPLQDLAVTHLYLGGFSQSGVDVATFASAFNGLTRMSDGSAVFDGYLPAAHAASMTPLQAGSSVLPTFEFTPMGPVDVPVIDLETQADVEGFRAEISAGFEYTNQGGATVRRNDSDAPDDQYRLYEIAAAPHAAWIPGCDGEGSSFPTDAFMRGAVQLLYRWAEDGTLPPTAERIELTTLDVVSVPAVDEVGNALAGVRSPFVDAPLVRYDGAFRARRNLHALGQRDAIDTRAAGRPVRPRGRVPRGIHRRAERHDRCRLLVGGRPGDADRERQDQGKGPLLDDWLMIRRKRWVPFESLHPMIQSHRQHLAQSR